MEVSPEHLHKCYKEIRDWTGYKNIVKTWELCENCIDHLEGAMKKEIDSIHGEGMSAEKCIRQIEEVLSRDITICDRPEFHIDGTSTTIAYPGGKDTLECLFEIGSIIKEYKKGK